MGRKITRVGPEAAISENPGWIKHIKLREEPGASGSCL
jgi:hypothetical protein